jgi:hypothetical protein
VGALETAEERLRLGDRVGARASMQFFLDVVNDPRRRLPLQPLLSAEAVAQLDAAGRYLMERL